MSQNVAKPTRAEAKSVSTSEELIKGKSIKTLHKSYLNEF
jgi:hypothetical protein